MSEVKIVCTKVAEESCDHIATVLSVLLQPWEVIREVEAESGITILHVRLADRPSELDVQCMLHVLSQLTPRDSTRTFLDGKAVALRDDPLWTLELDLLSARSGSQARQALVAFEGRDYVAFLDSLPEGVMLTEQHAALASKLHEEFRTLGVPAQRTTAR
jgi:hypothetical protein